MSYQEARARGMKKRQISEEEVTWDEARPGGETPAIQFLYVENDSLQRSVSQRNTACYWARIIAVTVNAHHCRLVSAREFPTLPSVCLLSSNWGQVGISHNVVHISVRNRKKERKRRGRREWEMDANWPNLPSIPETEWKVSWGFSSTAHTWLISLFGPVFVGALRSP